VTVAKDTGQIPPRCGQTIEVRGKAGKGLKGGGRCAYVVEAQGKTTRLRLGFGGRGEVKAQQGRTKKRQQKLTKDPYQNNARINDEKKAGRAL